MTVHTLADLFLQPGPFLVSELSLVLRCSERYIQKLIKAGIIDAGKLGRNYRIPAAEARRIALSILRNANGANVANGAK